MTLRCIPVILKCSSCQDLILATPYRKFGSCKTFRCSAQVDYNSQPKRPSLRQIMPLDTRERRHRRGFREPDPQVELLGQAGVEVMALPLRLRAVDHTDGALKTLAL